MITGKNTSTKTLSMRILPPGRWSEYNFFLFFLLNKTKTPQHSIQNNL